MNDVKRPYRGISADDRQRSRRGLLIDACLDVIGGGGVNAVTAEAVSAQAKLTKRYFYESFAGREALLLAALDEMFDELIADIRSALANNGRQSRARAVTEVFVASLAQDPRRARLYAESPAVPALQARREDAIVAFTDLISASDGNSEMDDHAQRRLMTRIVVAGVTEIVTGWINGSVSTDRAKLTSAIVTLAQAMD